MKMHKTDKRMNRRDVLKLAALSGAGTLAGTSEAEANDIKSSNKKNISKKHPLHIAIIGGGMAGTTLAYRLSRAISYPVITLYEPEENSCWYQPGMTMVGTGIWPMVALEYSREDYLPMHVTRNKNAVTSVDADTRTITDSSGKSMHYDYIIAASGLTLDFSAIDGLKGELTSLEGIETVKTWMNDPSIGSVYYLHGAIRLSRQLDRLIEKGQKLADGKKLQVLFSQPKINIKSPAAAKSVLMSLIERVKKAGLQDHVEIIFTAEDGKLSANKVYDSLYKKMFKKEHILFQQKELRSINTTEQKAMFTDGEEKPYDFIHITPPMKASPYLTKSSLLNNSGFIDVNEKTLEHKVHPRIFAIGDIAGCAALKSASAIIKQVKTIADTIRALDEEKKPSATYDGYGSDTLLCASSKSILFEAWDFKEKPLSPVIELNPLECHSIYWYSSLYLAKTYMMKGVLRGWA